MLLTVSQVFGFYLKADTLQSTIKGDDYKVLNSFDPAKGINGWELNLKNHMVQGVKVYRGTVANHVSNVLLVEHSDHISGLIEIGNIKYRIDALNVVQGQSRSMVLYNTNDMATGTAPCSTMAHQIAKLPLTTSMRMNRLNKRAGNEKVCEMALLADASFISRFGNDTKSKMVEALEVSNGIFQSNFNVQLVAKEIQLLSDASLIVNTAQTPSDILQGMELEDKDGRYGPNADTKNFCLSHLFTYKDFQGVTGLAEQAGKNGIVAGICQGGSNGANPMNVGLSTANLRGNDLSITGWHTTVVHEIAHGFGSGHDDDTSCSNETTMIMHTVINADRNTMPEFSECSKTAINSQVARAACLGGTGNSTNIQEPQGAVPAEAISTDIAPGASRPSTMVSVLESTPDTTQETIFATETATSTETAPSLIFESNSIPMPEPSLLTDTLQVQPSNILTDLPNGGNFNYRSPDGTVNIVSSTSSQ